MTALIQALEWLMQALILWLKVVCRPIETLNRLLQATRDENHLSEAIKVWVVSLLLTEVVNVPVHRLYGIQITDLGFHLFNWLMIISSLLMLSVITHKVLLFYKQKSEYVRTLVMLSTLVIGFSPITTLVMTISTARIFELLRSVKEKNVPLDAVPFEIFEAFKQSVNSGTLNGPITAVLSFVVLVISLVLLALFAEAVTQWYGNNRAKTFSAVSLGLTLSSVGTIGIVLPLQYLLIFSSL